MIDEYTLSNDVNIEEYRIETFEELGLKDNLLRGIYNCGYEEPSPVQQKAIKVILTGRDVVVQAQSGLGKTATFLISLLERIDENDPTLQAIILSPTRDLATQTLNTMNALSQKMKVKSYLCIGGNTTNSYQDFLNIKRGVQVLIGTPGRISEMIHKKVTLFNKIKMIIVDEADEMLCDNFKEQLGKIFCSILKVINVQIVFLSATFAPDILKLCKDIMIKPLFIMVKREQLTLEGIKQYYIFLEDPKWKLETLFDLFEIINITQSIIYCNTKNTVDFLYSELTKKNFTVCSFHSSMQQIERNDIMQKFRSGQIRVLITTDILARGIDVQQVSLVLNYDLPNEIPNYIHRIGRCGRYGRKGVAINLISKHDINKLRDIENYYSAQIEEMPNNINEIINETSKRT